MKHLLRYSEAALPTPRGDFRLVVYRMGGDPRDEHLAMVYGEVAGREGVLCRVHSECLTGEVLGSLRCDCRQQLDLALDRIAGEGRGVLVYLRQEGRGIGLGNKVRAYALQDRGVDTVDANVALGFDADLRSYEIAAAILGDLGLASVRLMTNNPRKLDGLARAGIPVAGHEPHWVEAGAHSAEYLRVKQDKMGHLGGRSGRDRAGPGPSGRDHPDLDAAGSRPAPGLNPLEKDASGQ